MPTYEFSCPICGKTFESSLPVGTDQTEIRCPSGHPNARKIYSVPSVIFKGSGFYKTDHSSGSAPNGGAKKS